MATFNLQPSALEKLLSAFDTRALPSSIWEIGPLAWLNQSETENFHAMPTKVDVWSQTPVLSYT